MSKLATKGPQGRFMTKAAPTGGHTSGDLVIVRAGTSGLCAVVEDTKLVGVTTVLQYGHQVKIPKLVTTGNAWSQGDLLYRDSSTGKLTNTVTGNALAGAATAAALLADTEAWAQLNLT